MIFLHWLFSDQFICLYWSTMGIKLWACLCYSSVSVMMANNRGQLVYWMVFPHSYGGNYYHGNQSTQLCGSSDVVSAMMTNDRGLSNGNTIESSHSNVGCNNPIQWGSITCGCLCLLIVACYRTIIYGHDVIWINWLVGFTETLKQPTVVRMIGETPSYKLGIPLRTLDHSGQTIDGPVKIYHTYYYIMWLYVISGMSHGFSLRIVSRIAHTVIVR